MSASVALAPNFAGDKRSVALSVKTLAYLRDVQVFNIFCGVKLQKVGGREGWPNLEHLVSR